MPAENAHRLRAVLALCLASAGILFTPIGGLHAERLIHRPSGGASTAASLQLRTESLHLVLPSGLTEMKPAPLGVIRTNQVISLAAYFRTGGGARSGPMTVIWSVSRFDVVVSEVVKRERRPQAGATRRYAVHFVPASPGSYGYSVRIADGTGAISAAIPFTVTPGAGHLGTTFRAGDGLELTLVHYERERRLQAFPGGPFVYPRSGDEFIGAGWYLRNTRRTRTPMGSFVALSSAGSSPWRGGRAGFAGILLPGQVEDVGGVFEVRAGDPSTRIVYRPSKPGGFAPTWSVR